MSEFLKKQRDHAEAKKLGRVVDTETVGEGGKVRVTQTVLSSRKNPRLTMRYMVPAERKRAICKPGSEDA